MRLRVFLFEDEEGIRKLVNNVLEKRHYEVYSFDHPARCKILDSSYCQCDENHQCADILICDRYFGDEDCIDFFKDMFSRNCKAKFFAIMSAALGYDELDWAEANGVKVFTKPYIFDALDEWLDHCEKETNPNRKLINI